MNRILRGTGTIIAAVLMFALVGTTSAQAAPAVKAAPAASHSIDFEIPDIKIPAKDKAAIEAFCKDPIGTIKTLAGTFLSAAELAFFNKILPQIKALAAEAEKFFAYLIDLWKKHHDYLVTSLDGQKLKKPIEIDILFKLCGNLGGGTSS